TAQVVVRDVGERIYHVIAVALRCVRYGLRVAATDVVPDRNVAVGVVVAEDRKAIERPADWVRVPISRRLRGHHTHWRGMVSIIVAASRMAIKSIQLSESFGVAVGGRAVTLLNAGIENRNAINRHA